MSRPLGELLTELGATDAKSIVLKRIPGGGSGPTLELARQRARARDSSDVQWRAHGGGNVIDLDWNEYAALLNAGAQREE
ncbi:MULTISPECIES: hypothetical protein [Myxococcus]|uniref:hypothetical protein n=1 Tax=Myxococcus TaxID=32 RepID=UPI001143EDFC|nr:MULTISPECIES: hypothetical protein [Myxococcus]NOK06964.1 hypothetical protein [Myxococcus xanthus]